MAVALTLAACGTSSPSGGSGSAGQPGSGDGSGTPIGGNTPACGWVLQSDADVVNVAYPDQSATYWVALIPNIPGARLRIDGQYPDARYFSFNVYDPALRPIDGIADRDIAPSDGTVNPYAQPGVASGGHYSVRVEFKPRPDTPAANTLYSGSTTLGDALAIPNPVTAVLYRIYIPADGLPPNADVPLPTLTLETANGSSVISSQAACSEPQLSTLIGQLGALDLNGSLIRIDYPDQLDVLPLRFPTATYPPTSAVFYGLPDVLLRILDNLSPVELPAALQGTELLSGGGFLSNSDAAYTSSAFSRSDGNIFVMRARAPSWRGAPGVNFNAEDLRYWSVCQNEFATQRYVACTADEQTAIDADGFFTVMVSDAADRPANATQDHGITWLPWGPYPDGLLLYRHMLPNPAFAQAIQNVPFGTDPVSVMGDYFPSVAYCTKATAEAAGNRAWDVFAACANETAERAP
ncbi:hypothetical protein [Solimonas terrae]|uniref:hypothetical protein n=1 Tax=Solimonas terrae TaxID=1396819 RepID=UPI00140C9DAD|nr:hypothetical protein [Solimonas terrae]